MIQTMTGAEATFQASAARVAKHFPHLARAHIDAIMRSEYAELADRPLQMYVSNLVEHDTRTRLTREARKLAS